MIYQLDISLYFEGITIPDKARQDALWLLSKAVIVNPGQENEQRGYLRLLKCHHDKTPSQPCEAIYDISP